MPISLEKWEAEIDQIRTCTKCGYSSTGHDFRKQGSTCKRCNNEAARLYRKNNPEKVKATREKYQQDREKIRLLVLKNMYNLSSEEYFNMLENQKHRCAICGTDNPGKGKSFSVDHDHACCSEDKKSCGKCVRGLICQPCNSGLGYFRDSCDNLQKACEYLTSYKERMEEL